MKLNLIIFSMRIMIEEPFISQKPGKCSFHHKPLKFYCSCVSITFLSQDKRHISNNATSTIRARFHRLHASSEA